ncbi:MAG TPA: ankyrin repeat domain-containing protein [Chthoniobacterales bacterium]|nr:ankyrin repeat domain-containing protein [Chthoniobacterales bacterium]
MPRAARSVEELFPLIEFCKTGDLKAVSDWIAKGNPLDLPPGKKTRRASPLQIAIEKGFLTLTELLLDAGADPGNGNALSIAVRSKRIDIARLLLDRGVPVNAVDFETVRYSCDPELIQLFLDRGADPITGYPIYRGFQNVLKPIIAVYKTNIDKVPALQLQADMALCYFAKEGNLRCVSPSIAELRARAEDFILEIIRNTPAFDFWKTELWESLENARVRRALGMSKEDERSCYEILEAAVEKINKHSRSFRVSLDGQRHYVSSLTVILVKGKEWDDACSQVWAGSSSEDPRRITEPG